MALARYDIYNSFFSADKEKSSTASYKNAEAKGSEFIKSSYASEIYPELGNIEKEADALFQIFLDSQGDPEKLKESGLIDMLTFTSQLLLIHNQSYPKKSEIKRHEARLKSIRVFLEIDELEVDKKDPIKTRYDWIIASVNKNFNDFWTLLCSPAQLRDQLGWTNLTRIFWIFYHFSINEMILIAKDAAFLDKLGQALGSPIDLDAFYNLLNTPNDVLNILSVAFFGVRLVIDLIMLAKHTYSDEMDTDNATTMSQRLIAELEKRLPNITNCIVWGGVNAATNYSSAFGIPLQLAMPIVAGVLMFDTGLALFMRHRNEQAYVSALTTLEAQIAKVKSMEGEGNSNYLAVLNKQVAVLKEKKKVDNEVFKFNSFAAVLMMSSFMASLLFVAPVAILACYVVCCFSLALYSCAEPGKGEYAQYITASRNLAYAQSQADEFNAEQLQQLADKVNQTFDKLIFDVLERALLPLALLSIFAINPIIGLATTAAYLAYKINTGFVSDTEIKEPEPELNRFSLSKIEPKVASSMIEESDGELVNSPEFEKNICSCW